MFISLEENAGWRRESKSKFKYLGSVLGSGNGANIYSRILCLHLLSKNIQIAKYRTVILIFFTWV